MANYKAPLREIDFVLNKVLNAGQLAELPGFEDATPDFTSGLLDEAAKLIESELAPLNASGDAQGCRWDNGEVRIPDGFAEAYKLYWESGWVGLCNPVELGGQGLPYTLSKVVEEMTCSANVAFALYPGLTTSCFEALLAMASEPDRKRYLSKLATGEWTGAMCLTEPQAGSDLAGLSLQQVNGSRGSTRRCLYTFHPTTGLEGRIDTPCCKELFRCRGMFGIVVGKILGDIKPDSARTYDRDAFSYGGAILQNIDVA